MEVSARFVVKGWKCVPGQRSERGATRRQREKRGLVHGQLATDITRDRGVSTFDDHYGVCLLRCGPTRPYAPVLARGTARVCSLHLQFDTRPPCRSTTERDRVNLSYGCIDIYSVWRMELSADLTVIAQALRFR